MEMTKRKPGVAEELRRLSTLTVTELGSKYAELFGEPARSRNRNHLLRRISWRIQANASQVDVTAGMVNVNAAMSKFSGVVQCDTLISTTVISSAYTPGAGNVW